MLKVELADKSTIVLTGRFDASQVSQADPVFDSLEGNSVLDCRGLDYISSAGIGVVLGAYKRLHEQGHTLTMINVNDHIRQVFRYAGLDKIIKM
ncbi:MAG TPA: STAS domain-containing protein [bacterium]|nr:STAS domain-containing protein [bacterium]